MLDREVKRLSNHAVTLLNSEKRKTALPLLKRAGELTNDPGVWCNLAIAYTNEGKYVEASQILHQLVTRNPKDLAAWHAYGVLNLVSALPQDAVGCFEKCCELDPKNGAMVFDYSIALMQAGYWQKGLECYESRREWKPERYFPGLPKWTGEEGKSVYVWAEQGIGDTFQFARFIPWLSKRCKRVVFALPADLHSLFKGYSEYCEIVGHVQDISDVDFEAPLMSLARHYVEVENDAPMFLEDLNLLASNVQPRKIVSDRLKVGVCWATNPSSHHYLERSLPFGSFLEITENSGCSFHSLQIGPASADIIKNSAQLVVEDLSSEMIDDWSATASIIKAMDIVVTTDTSVAHLAAILRKPTIMFLARRDWWRWGNEGETTPWYPSMTIIRQEAQNTWGPEFAKVSAMLGEAARNRLSKKAA